jgi:flavin-dependent dehydrogenase
MAVNPARGKLGGRRSDYVLNSGARVAVVGGGPSGAFFSYFLLETAGRIDQELSVDIYEPKDFPNPGPGGCNMCGGIISESLVQLLATEGINLPANVVQRGIDSYVLHMDVGSVRIDPPGHEKRIAAVHRGGGPRGSKNGNWGSFDQYLLELAGQKGASVIRERVTDIAWEDGLPRIVTKLGRSDPYDLTVLAMGVNNASHKFIDTLGLTEVAPQTTKTFICEIDLGAEMLETYMGSSMHVFLLNLPRLEFAALIPKGEYVTLVLLGEQVDKSLVASFFDAPEVKACFPPGWTLGEQYCRCFPSINIRGSVRPYADRLVLIGDAGESRLYKDGIGGAYRTAKAAAKTALFHGVSADDFHRWYRPTCRSLGIDNKIGKLIFSATGLLQGLRFARSGILRMVAREQTAEGAAQRLSGVLWDTFTGSAPYRDVFRRTLHPFFLGRLGLETARGALPVAPPRKQRGLDIKEIELGKVYHDGEVIIRQGDVGHHMYVIQAGSVEVVREDQGREVRLAELGEGEFFGEMAIFEKDVRSATIRASGEVRVLSVDKKMLLRKIHEDPSLAFRIMKKMSHRIRDLDVEVVRAGSPEF